MAATSTIEWTDATWNVVTGCSVVSPGCANCYAMRLAGTRLKDHWSRMGLTKPSKAGPVWTGALRLNEPWLDQPLRWARARRIFVAAHSDLFHQLVPRRTLDRIFAVMCLAPRHQFQVPTKRAARMREYMNDPDALSRVADEAAISFKRRDQSMSFTWPPPNVWLGVSAEDQERANERIPDLLATPAAKRFVSLEPLLEPITLFDLDGPIDVPDGMASPLHWVIVGGESGPGARPMHPDWARAIRDQCAATGVPFFFKQWGAWLPINHAHARVSETYFNRYGREKYFATMDDGQQFLCVGKKAAGATLDGFEYREMPG